jgi:hypothetical protein
VNTKNKIEKRPLSLAPLSFEEAVTDILKVKPMPKPLKKREKKRTKAGHA